MAMPRAAGSASPGTLRVLVADDSPVQLLFVEHALRALGHLPVTARNGREAVERCLTDAPDVVLLDLEMPVLDGIGACRAIRGAPLAQQPTIVFVTATQDELELARCLDAGGDAFLTKPVSSGVLGAQLASFARSRALTRLVHEQSAELLSYRERLDEEMRVARGVFDNVVANASHGFDNVRVRQVDASSFAGDLVLCAESPFGEQFLFVGDCTGHGLPAALSALPAADAFTSLVRRGLDGAGILAGINDRLIRSLPNGYFVAAALVGWNPLRQVLNIWNGGLPDLYLWRPEDGIIQTVGSMHPPLGVLPSSETVFTPTWFAPEPGDRVLVHTDGLSEATDANDLALGEHGVRRWISMHPKTPPFESLDAALTRVGATDGRDDVAIAELECRARSTSSRASDVVSIPSEHPQPTSGRVLLEIEAGALRDIDPLPVAAQLLASLPSLGERANDVQVVLGEMLANAVQHGVLGLESQDKQTPEGFALFYQRVRACTARVQHGWVRVELQQFGIEDGYALSVRVSDSGEGYEPREAGESPEALLSGRGLRIVNEMADYVRVLNAGRTIEATFRLPGT